MSLNLYCDAEVGTRLTLEPLSLAVVSDEGPEFYVELQDSGSTSSLDMFARDEVVPQFGRVVNARVPDTHQMAQRLAEFLQGVPEATQLHVEHDAIPALLQRLLAKVDGGPALWSRLRVCDMSGQLDGPIFEMAAERSSSRDLFKRLGLHHALSDARALRAKVGVLRGALMPTDARASAELARAFLADRGVDHRGRMLSEILAWPDDKLETTDDFAQWLFPLPEPSPFVPQAPAPSLADFALMARDDEVRSGIARAGQRFLQYLGLEFDGEQVRKSSRWPQRRDIWLVWSGDRDRHISRMLRASSLLGFHDAAVRVEQALEAISIEVRGAPASSRAISFWREAVRLDPSAAPRRPPG